VCVVMLIVTTITLHYLWKFAKAMLDLQEQIEESLDIIDSYYQRINVIASTPLMVDEPYVREMMGLIRNFHSAILMIANKIVVFGKKTEK